MTMSIELQTYLQGHNFTKCGPRPPAIGEENEVDNDGRMSTHSSVSGKSEVSSATPRRTDIDLGFEPEGSASPLPMCDRWKLSLSHMLDDSEGVKLFRSFLGEKEVILECWLACKGFRDSGTRNNFSNNSSAASSTTGPLTSQRSQPDFATLETRTKLAKKIFKTYFEKDKCCVSNIIKDSTRSIMRRKIKTALQTKQDLLGSSSDLDASLFDQAQSEIEHDIEGNSYVSFLQSDLFRQHIAQWESKHTKQPQVNSIHSYPLENKNHSHILSNNLQQPAVAIDPVPMPGRYLDRLDENKVWHPHVRSKSDITSSDKDQTANSTISSGYSQSSLARNVIEQAAFKTFKGLLKTGDNPDQTHPAYPYLSAPSVVKYYVPPASANASDNASSDATSDTHSMTDGSLDVDSAYSANKNRKRIMRHQTKRNPTMHYAGEENFVPLTRRCNYQQSIANLATKNPKEFFAQLKFKLEKVIEERRRAEILEAVASEDLDQILDSHIERVMKTPIVLDSPGGNHSPPPINATGSNISSQQKHRHLLPTSHGVATSDVHQDARRYHQQKEMADRVSMQNRFSNIDPNGLPARKMDSLRRRKEGMIGMSQNEVPDVPAIEIEPVDRAGMVMEWVKQSTSSNQVQPQSNSMTRKRGNISKGGLPHHLPMYINRGSFQEVVTSRANQSQTQPLQPISQDPAMPPLDQPDASNTIEEVKRRLIEAAEKRECESLMHSLTLGSQSLSQMSYSSFSDPSFSGIQFEGTAHTQRAAMQSGHHPGAHYFPSEPTNLSSSSEATLQSDTNHRDNHSVASSKSESGRTTCVYYMPDENIGYKIYLPHSPVTLGQFKVALSRKGNYKYYFKQYSEEVGGPVHFEIKNDDEFLPLWESAVVAKVEPYDN